METNRFYNEILTEHNLHPEFKHDLPDADIELAGVNPSCGDEIRLKLKTDGQTITDGGLRGQRLRRVPGVGGHHAGHGHRHARRMRRSASVSCSRR